MEDPGRRQHYGRFYGVSSGPAEGPVGLVHGNCQAEALRVLLAPHAPVELVRVPPVHELQSSDLPHLEALLARCVLLVTQPVRDGYRGLPLGSREVAARLPAGARVVTVPALRWSGLHPWQAIVRHPSDPSLPPPVVDYHDLRTLAAAALGTSEPVAVDPDAVREVAELSRRELARREEHLDVRVSGLLPAAFHTLNHPGNALLRAVASQVLDTEVTDPGRELLGRVRTPVEAAVTDALRMDVEPRDHWLVDGERVEDETVRRAQLAWYAQNPSVVGAGLARHGERMRLLGLLT